LCGRQPIRTSTTPQTGFWENSRGISTLHHASGETDVARTSTFAYNAQGMVTDETVEPDSISLWLKTSYTYDSFGNRISVTISGPEH